MDNNKKRGRPRKNQGVVTLVKKERGRPRKYDVIEREVEEIKVNDKVYLAQHAKITKVDSDYLVRHLLGYFTKIMIIHNEMSKQKGLMQPLFERLKTLDFQMTEVCQELLNPL
jgi:hypothetical protein